MAEEGESSARAVDGSARAPRRRFQYTVRSLLALMFLVSLAGSWIASLRKQYVEQLKLAEAIVAHGGEVKIRPGSHPWLDYFVGQDFNQEVWSVQFCTDGGCLNADIVKGMPRLFALEAFNASYTAIADDELSWLPQARRLTTLNLNSARRVTNRTIEYLANNTELHEVDLRATAIDDMAIKHLIELKKLRDLDVSHTNVTDEGLAMLADAKLKVLFVGGSNVTDKSVEILGRYRTIRRRVKIG